MACSARAHIPHLLCLYTDILHSRYTDALCYPYVLWAMLRATRMPSKLYVMRLWYTDTLIPCLCLYALFVSVQVLLSPASRTTPLGRSNAARRQRSGPPSWMKGLRSCAGPSTRRHAPLAPSRRRKDSL